MVVVVVAGVVEVVVVVVDVPWLRHTLAIVYPVCVYHRIPHVVYPGRTFATISLLRNNYPIYTHKYMHV